MAVTPVPVALLPLVAVAPLDVTASAAVPADVVASDAVNASRDPVGSDGAAPPIVGVSTEAARPQTGQRPRTGALVLPQRGQAMGSPDYPSSLSPCAR